MFRVTDAALARGERVALTAARATLQDYPLYPYLLYRDLNQRLDEFPATEVRAFLRDYDDLPLAGQLRSDWLQQLAETERWDDYLQDYRATGNITLDCQHRRALLARGRVTEALADIESIWVHGHSRPDACDPVFAVWRERGGFTRERIWQRFELAMAAGQDGLGRYLRNLMQGEQRAAADRWLRIHAEPQRLRELEPDPTQPHAADIVLHGLQLLSRRDSVATAPLFDELQARHRRNGGPGWDRLQRQLALFVAARGHHGAAARLAALPDELVDEDVEAWRIRVPLRQQDWPEVLRQTERLRPDTAQQLDWRYWRARALEATGDSDSARTLYAELAEQRDYYGFLAADRLRRDYRIEHRPTHVSAAVLEAMTQQPAMLRSRELWLLNRVVEARREWQQALDEAEPDQLRAAALLTDDWGWHDRAIVALARAGDWDDLTLRFPLPYRDQVIAAARGQALDPAWVYAVMRQESLFQADARSSANALGLMQILPSTGQQIAARLGENWGGNASLLDPAISIRYGAHYLSGNLDRLQLNPVLASAAYNAGTGRVLSWLPEDEAIDAAVWAETIPFFETRGYIRRVLEYSVVYAWRLGMEPLPLHTRMRPIQPGG